MIKLELGRKEMERILSWYEYLTETTDPAKVGLLTDLTTEDFDVYQKLKSAYDRYCKELSAPPRPPQCHYMTYFGDSGGAACCLLNEGHEGNHSHEGKDKFFNVPPDAVWESPRPRFPKAKKTQ